MQGIKWWKSARKKLYCGWLVCDKFAHQRESVSGEEVMVSRVEGQAPVREMQ